MRRQSPWIVWAVIICALAAVSAAYAQHSVHPATYRSPSGSYELFVDPSEEYGGGPCRVTLTREGERIWQCDYDFTIWDAVVTDDGRVVGYALAWGYYGFAPPGIHDMLPGEQVSTIPNVIWVVVFDHAGTIVTQAPYERGGPNYMTTPQPPKHPVPQGITVVEDQDAVIVRAKEEVNGDAVLWWIYRLSDGAHIADVKPDVPTHQGMGFVKEIDAIAVPGMPCVATHWYIRHQGRESAAITLTDLQGCTVWSHQFDDEYADLGERWNWWTLGEMGIKQVTTGPRTVTFTSLTSGEETTFAWQENGRLTPVITHAPAVDLRAAARARIPSAQGIPEVDAEVIGTITLGAALEAPSLFGDIYDFSMDDRGRIGWIRSVGDDKRITLITPDGALVREIALEAPPGVSYPKAVWCRGDRWLIFAATYQPVNSIAWWVDSEAGTAGRLAEVGADWFEAVAPLKDAGFAAIVRHSTDYTLDWSVATYDDTGIRQWCHALDSGDGIAVTTDGLIAVLEGGIYDRITLYDRDGAVVRTASVTKLLGRKPNYLSGLQADADGGLILHDFRGTPPICRLDREWNVTECLSPRWENGETFHLRGDVRIDPAGELWTSDGHSFLRLGEGGVVAMTIGSPPAERPLRRISGLTVGPDGRIYAANADNSFIHVYDDTGQPVSILKPDPTDFGSANRLTKVMVAHDGSVYFESQQFGRGTGPMFLKFAPDGTRIGFVRPSPNDCYGGDWYFKPNAPQRWLWDCKGISLVGDDGSIDCLITRRPDRNWIESILDCAVAPDGSLAIIACSQDRSRNDLQSICTYSPTGEPGAVIPYRGYGFTRGTMHAPPYVAVCDSEGVLVYDTTDPTACVRVKYPDVATEREPYWSLHANPKGDELWMRESNSTEIIRVRFPRPGDSPVR